MEIKTEEKAIESFIDSHIQPTLDELQNKRNEIRKVGKRNRLAVLPLFGGGLLFAYNEALAWADSFVLATGIFGGIAFVAIAFFFSIKPHVFADKKRKNALKQFFKKQVVHASVKYIDPQLVYKPLYKTGRKQLERSKLFPKATEIKEDDAILREWKSAKVKMSELHVMKGMKVLFNGIFIQFVFEKPLQLLQQEVGGDAARIQDAAFQRIVSDFQEELHSEVKISSQGRELFVAVPIEKPLFEPSFGKRNDEAAVQDILFFQKTYAFVKRIVDYSGG